MRFAFAFIVLLTGCSSIQVVRQTPAGGVVDLRGPTEAARAKAEEHMRAQCPFGYTIVDEHGDEIAYACKAPSTTAPPLGRSPSAPAPASPREFVVHI